MILLLGILCTSTGNTLSPNQQFQGPDCLPKFYFRSNKPEITSLPSAAAHSCTYIRPSACKSNYEDKLVWGAYRFLLLLDPFQLGLSPQVSFLHSQQKLVLASGRLQRQDKQFPARRSYTGNTQINVRDLDRMTWISNGSN